MIFNLFISEETGNKNKYLVENCSRCICLKSFFDYSATLPNYSVSEPFCMMIFKYFSRKFKYFLQQTMFTIIIIIILFVGANVTKIHRLLILTLLFNSDINCAKRFHHAPISSVNVRKMTNSFSIKAHFNCF